MWHCTCKAWQMRSWGSRGCGWVVSQSTTFLMTNEMSSLFFFFLFSWELRNTRKSELWFFFFFSKTFFLKKTILYDSHAKARIVLGWIYFKYQRSIFTYCILESSWWKRHNCGCLSCGVGVGVHGASSAWVFYLNMCLFWIMLPQAKLSRYFYFCIESHNWNMWNI